MMWLLVYTHAYEQALNHISDIQSNLDEVIKEYDEEATFKRVVHLQSVLKFIEKRIKLIKYDN